MEKVILLPIFKRVARNKYFRGRDFLFIVFLYWVATKNYFVLYLQALVALVGNFRHELQTF